MTSVLVVGMATVDFLFEVDVMPTSTEKYSAGNAQIIGGGGAANAACAIAKLGGHALLAARVGDDMIGKLIVEELKVNSVDCSLLIASDNARSSFSSVLLDAQGERQIVNYRGCDLSDDVSAIELASPTAVLTDTRWTKGTIAALRLARENGIPGVLDAEAPCSPEAMALASHIAFSRQGLESLAGSLGSISDIEAALRMVATSYPAWIAVTDGGNGAYILNKGEFDHEPASMVDVLDTLGAGDVWHGAFTWRLGCGNNEKDSVRFANAAATLKCSRSGGGRSCPDLAEVMALLEQQV